MLADAAPCADAARPLPLYNACNVSLLGVVGEAGGRPLRELVCGSDTTCAAAVAACCATCTAACDGVEIKVPPPPAEPQRLWTAAAIALEEFARIGGGDLLGGESALCFKYFACSG